MTRIKLSIAYLGSDFSGWQLQAFNLGKEPRTVQGELEKALAVLLRQPVRVHGAGRTDAGVHADCQVLHFDLPEGFNHKRVNWLAALNTSLPRDISVLRAEEVDESFHARFNAKEKVYTYCLWLEYAFIPPKLRPLAWACGPLDLQRMEQAAACLLGEHDFAAFRNRGAKEGSSKRCLYEIRPFYTSPPGAAELDPQGRCLAWRFRGNGFLKQMVRNLIGFMVSVGRGKLEPEDALRLFESGDRTLLDFPTAPAWGLTLTDVIY